MISDWIIASSVSFICTTYVLYSVHDNIQIWGDPRILCVLGYAVDARMTPKKYLFEAEVLFKHYQQTPTSFSTQSRNPCK